MNGELLQFLLLKDRKTKSERRIDSMRGKFRNQLVPYYLMFLISLATQQRTHRIKEWEKMSSRVFLKKANLLIKD